MTANHTPTIVYGREIANDVYGAPLVFETRFSAETFPGITCPVVGPVLVLHVWNRFHDHIPAAVDAVAFHEPTFCGRNANLYFEVTTMTPAAALDTPEYRALQAAEAAYTAELLAAFGPHGAEANRHNVAFMRPGSPLAVAYDAMRAAETAWRALMIA